VEFIITTTNQMLHQPRAEILLI